MDNFMDKLAKRFNAGEIIQANGEAEARENQRLREQTEEYDKIMQEIRRLNLKTMEVSEQVSQMISCGIEQLESYENKGTLEETAEDVNQMQNYKLENIEAQLRALSDGLSVLGNNIDTATDYQDEFISLARKVDTVRDEASQTRERLSVLGSDLTEGAQNQTESVKQIKDMIVNLRICMDEVQKHIEEYVHKEDVKVYRNVQAVLNEQLNSKTRELSDHINRVDGKVEKMSGIKGMLFLTMLFSVASVVLQVLRIMGIL